MGSTCFFLLEAGGQSLANRRSPDPTDNRIFPQMPLALGGLAAEQVTPAALAVLDFSRRGQLVPLFHSLVGFLFGHNDCSDFCYLSSAKNGGLIRRGGLYWKPLDDFQRSGRQ